MKKLKVPYELAYTLVLSKQYMLPVFTVTTTHSQKKSIDNIINQISQEFKNITLVPVKIVTDRLYLKHHIPKLPQYTILKLLMQGLAPIKTTSGEQLVLAEVI